MKSLKMWKIIDIEDVMILREQSADWSGRNKRILNENIRGIFQSFILHILSLHQLTDENQIIIVLLPSLQAVI